MKKKEFHDGVLYTIQWSKHHEYDRAAASRLIPETAGIVSFREKKGSEWKDLLMLVCWREGMRTTVKKFMDKDDSFLPETLAGLTDRDGRALWYRYTTVDSTRDDLSDVLFWLLREYEPEFNDVDSFCDSRRYREISVREEGEGGRVGRG